MNNDNYDIRYNIGDQVFYIDTNYRIIIKSTIVEIDDKIGNEPNETIFYWIDEPIGHAVTAGDEIFDVDTDINLLIEAAKISMEDDEASKIECFSLEEFRSRRIKFIMSTWPKEDCIFPELKVSDYPVKIKDVDWFNF